MIIPRAKARIFMAGDVRQDGNYNGGRMMAVTRWSMRLWYPDYAGLYAQALAVQSEGRATIFLRSER